MFQLFKNQIQLDFLQFKSSLFYILTITLVIFLLFFLTININNINQMINLAGVISSILVA